MGLGVYWDLLDMRFWVRAFSWRVVHDSEPRGGRATTTYDGVVHSDGKHDICNFCGLDHK